MSHVQLTAKHRPQTFARVAGQEEIRAILSRAAAQDRVAAAYLFSGTRGVGKTTLARIFAKALNCITAPTAEPCNNCHHCRQITIGSAPDVAEIDGASNRGIEQARRLKEDVGYAPMDCRYKVIIIDEAHMLTKEAFNALLKTMEEPPPRVTFIMATTEPHKFPATIVSRSQHYVFKMLSQQGLQSHLEHILKLEDREFEPAAVTLLARRAAGSVRDGMSLLEQVLTISEQTLRLEDVRRILGLAGGEMFQRLIQAMREQDCIAVHDVLGDLLRQGLDLGFFLRELAGLWRNLFLLRQAGEKALPLLDLPEEEGLAWQRVANDLSPTYIHAAWQITLEAQRKVLTSLEPAQALEMLLLNLTYLPALVPLDHAFAVPSGQSGQSGQSVQTAMAGSKSALPRESGQSGSGPHPSGGTTSRQSWRERTQSGVTPAAVPTPERASRPAARNTVPTAPVGPPETAIVDAFHRAASPSASERTPGSSSEELPRATRDHPPDSSYPPAPQPPSARFAQETRQLVTWPPQEESQDQNQDHGQGRSSAATHAAPNFSKTPQESVSSKSWEGFLEHYDRLCRSDQACFPGLRQIDCSMTEQGLTLRCRHMVQFNGLSDPHKRRALENLVSEYFGRALQVDLLAPHKGQAARAATTTASSLDKHPLVSDFVDHFKAKVVSVEPRSPGNTPARST
ncbi:DNA polymerase III subunit gamma/tau [Desulfonatronum thioautotrophicum]|uniref:DNA polymerase III subunit gamma/tau n=1 Tax=Desulfonatronum thioautotrophicum TaxID=617001 RepID=UPI0005EB1225|nr:DNA polymerase III subunit gamma/tau [Desulfonatronum thioautotrophicum]